MTSKTIGMITNIVMALAAVTGAWVAVMGLSTWKEKLLSELARRILRATYRVRDEISRVRNPFMRAGEISHALDEAGIEAEPDDPMPHPRTDEAVYQKRWKSLQEALSDLQVEEREAEVQWGRDVREEFRPLHECVSDLWIAISKHLHDRAEQSDPMPQSPLGAEERKKVDMVIYQLSPDPEEDEFTGRVAEAVKRIEERVRPHLRVRKPLKQRLRDRINS